MIVKEEYPIPIYFGKLILILTDDWELIDKQLGTKIADKNYSAVFFSPEDNSIDEYYIIMVDTTWSIISHEVVHVVNEIFLNRNIQLDRVNDEPQAYLTGWVTEQVDKFLKKHNHE